MAIYLKKIQHYNLPSEIDLSEVNSSLNGVNEAFNKLLQQAKIKSYEFLENWRNQLSNLLTEDGWTEKKPVQWEKNQFIIEPLATRSISDFLISHWNSDDFKEKIPIRFNFNQNGKSNYIISENMTDMVLTFLTLGRSETSDLNHLSLLKNLPWTKPFIIATFSEDTCELQVEKLNNTSHGSFQKFLEFTPELYEAGRGILTYFGTYLEEQYGDQKAKITIKQDDHKKTLIMTVEAESGEKEIIEKAYEEYRLIISKQAHPSEFTKKDSLILKLQQRIDIMEVEMKHEMRARMVAEGKHEQLIELLGQTLNQHTPITVHNHLESTSKTKAKAVAKASSSITIKQNLNSAIGGIEELKNLLPNKEKQELENLKQELKGLKEVESQEEFATSPILNKLRRTLENVQKGEGNLAATIKAAKDGYNIFNNIAQQYNSIADWCGLPQVPKVILKRS
ncbi:hypothetical protein [Roseivirga pacifica]